jgi:hypothetical protein
MTTKCFKCWQPWDGWGCVCNDCKRSEQLAEQTRLMVEANLSAKEQHSQSNRSSIKDSNLITFDDDRIVRPRTPEELEKEKLDNAEAFRVYSEAYNNDAVGIIVFVSAIIYLLYLWL